MSEKYDALLLVSFGGPEGRDDVMPFLENVLRGRNVPRERMLQVAEHYYQFDGVSPINQQNRSLIAGMREELKQHGPDLPIYWGNRNWHPMLADTLREMRDAGVDRALALFTSAYSSYSGCRQYREDIDRAREVVGEGAPVVDKLRVFFNHPGFVEANADRVRQALATLPSDRGDVELVFTAHSIPSAMAGGCRYEAQLKETAALVSDAVETPRWSLVYQSRSGPPTQPWLEPDVCEYLEQRAEGGDRSPCVIAPIGFISDHMEVIYDLDHEAREACERLEIPMARAGTVGNHPRFLRGLRELIAERMDDSLPKPALGTLGPSHDVCPQDCCLSGRPSRPPA